MGRCDVPNNVLRKAFVVFRAGGRRGDPAASHALSLFLAKIEAGSTSVPAALAYLANDAKISNFIEEVRPVLDIGQGVVLTAIESNLSRINSNVVGSRADQEDMRAEFKEILGIMRHEIAELRAVNAELRATSKEMHEDIKVAVKNTTLKAALVAGCAAGLVVSVFPGFPLNLGASAVYDRYLSRDAQKSATQKETAASCSPPPPKAERNAGSPERATRAISSPSAAVPLVVGSAGPSCPATGQTMLELLQGGRKVLLPTSQGMASVCLRPNAPLACKELQFQR